MAAPNIAGLTTITGKTLVANVTTTATNIVTNSVASSNVFKINSLYITNINGSTPTDITVSVYRSSVEYKLASTITVPADATLVVITRDTQLYLEEGDSLRIAGSANNALQAVCSYEIIS